MVVYSDMEKLHSFESCEVITGIKVTTWRRWAAQRRIAVVRLGRRVKVRESDLQAMIDGNIVPALPRRR
jgi:excisionase family DNA binding protein